MKPKLKTVLQKKRRWRIRKKVSGTAERPRLTVHFSGKHLYAQCIDDEAGKTLVFTSTLDKELRDKKVKNNLEGVPTVAKALAEKAKAAGIERVRSEEHTSELQSRGHLVCRLLLEKKK